MIKKIDLTGQRFGRLVVVKEGEPNKWGQRRWFCKCDCGNEKTIEQSNLRRGLSKSCGCLARERTSKANKKNITNKRFGILTAIKDSGEKQGRTSKWICICDCGNETTVAINHLNSGHTTSCGCLGIKQKMINGKKTGVSFSKKYGKINGPINIKKAIEENKKSYEKEGTNLTQITPERKINSNNTSGYKGIYWNKQSKKWTSSLTIKRKTINLGYFSNKQDAINARKEAEDKYFKPILDKYAHESK